MPISMSHNTPQEIKMYFKNIGEVKISPSMNFSEKKLSRWIPRIRNINPDKGGINVFKKAVNISLPK